MSLTIQELEIIKENISYAFNYIEVEICCSRKQTEENEKKGSPRFLLLTS